MNHLMLGKTKSKSYLQRQHFHIGMKNLTIPCEDTGAPDYTVQTYFVKSSKFGQLG